MALDPLDAAEMQALAAGLRHRLLAHAQQHADANGLATTPVPGLRLMCARRASGPIRSLYRPLVCVVLQGRKQLAVGAQTIALGAGQMVLVGMDAPVVGTVTDASPEAPYLAVALELDLAVLHALAAAAPPAPLAVDGDTARTAPTSLAVMGCMARFMRLAADPASVPALHAALSTEFHHALLNSAFAPLLWRLALAGPVRKVAQAVQALREDFRSPVSVGALASLACMSEPTFYRRFRDLTSLTPIQFQKQLRLIEARRLMLFGQYTATRAALDVGYQSVPQFTREYTRMFGRPPARETRDASGHLLLKT